MSCPFLCRTWLDICWYWSTGVSVTPCNFLLAILGFTNGTAHLWERCWYQEELEKRLWGMVQAQCGWVNRDMLWSHTFVIDINVGALTPCSSAWLDGGMVEQTALSCLDEGCVRCCHKTARQVFTYTIYTMCSSSFSFELNTKLFHLWIGLLYWSRAIWNLKQLVEFHSQFSNLVTLKN